MRCEVFVPETSSRAKRDKLAALGAIVNVVGASYADALAASLARQAESGALLMHAYDQREVVVGAATLAAEVEADAGVPDRALVSVGGGGLIAGVCAWFAGRCAIDALEPELAPTLHRARAAGRPVDVEVSGIAADSLGARRIGAIAWPLTQRHVSASHLLGDAAIRAAQETMWRELRLAVEPAAALPLAALTTRRRRAAARREGAARGLRRQRRRGDAGLGALQRRPSEKVRSLAAERPRWSISRMRRSRS